MRPETVEAVRRLINAGGFQQTETVIAKYHAEFASVEARELMKLQLPRHANHSREHRVIATRLSALERSLTEGASAVFAGYDAAAEAILSLLNASDYDAIRKAIEDNRHHLFPQVADIAFADLVMQPSTPDEESVVLDGWTLVEQCRALGVEAALEANAKPRRGIILGPDIAASLASAGSPEEVQNMLEAVPEIVSRRVRRSEGQAQMAQWGALDEYSAAMAASAAPHDIQKRIDTCRGALASIDCTGIPIVWAMVALDLADALSHALQRQAGYSGMAPMGEVIALYQRVLEILTPEGEPDDYAHALRYLGDAYLRDAGGDQTENVEAAIRSYETALGLLRRAVESKQCAAVMAHLGEALLRRAHGDPSIDVDRAVAVLERAIEVLEPSDEKALLAAARLSLAAALIERISGSHDENLRAATRQLRNAMEDVEPADNPDIWAMASTQLGFVCLTRARTDLVKREALLRQAERHFRAALETTDTGLRVRAQAHSGLGWALSDQHGSGRDADSEAITHYQAAIELYEAMAGPAFDVNCGHAHRNFAIFYHERTSGDKAENIAAAERQFGDALKVFSRDEYPVERRDTFRAMAEMYFDAGQWTEAHRCFEEAISMSGGVLASRCTELGKEAEVAENRTMYGPAAYCLLRLGRPGEALETIERGKGRMLAEAIAWKDLDDSTLLSAEQRQATEWARSQMLRLEAENRRSGETRDIQRLARLERQLGDAYRHLASLRSGAPGTSDEALDLRSMLSEIPKGGALVVPLVTTRGSAALVVPSESDVVSRKHVVELDSLKITTLMDLLGGQAGSGGWLNAYLHWLNDTDAFPELLESLAASISTLWDVLMGPVRARLRALGIAEGAPVVLMPSGWLGLLPLHAARRTVDGRWRTFCEEFVVAYAPSIAILRACRRRLEDEERRGRMLVAVSNPTGDLRFADDEVAAIAALFERAGAPNVARILAREAAGRADVLGSLGGGNYIHFACHANFDWRNARESGLRLAGSDRLSMEDILSPAMDLTSSRLITLSACETGMTEFRTMPDEFVGLTGALIEAGAPAVISSLWPVDDISTKFLMTELYRLHLEGLGVAAALHRAQRWLSEATAEGLGLAEIYRRVHTASGGTDEAALKGWRYYEANPHVVPFAHPFYWAAFTATGVAAA